MEPNSFLKFFAENKKSFISLMLALVVLIMFLFAVDAQKVLHAIFSMNIYGLMAVFATWILFMMFRAKLLQLCFNVLKLNTSFTQSFKAENAHMFLNNITPGASFGGEPIISAIFSKMLKTKYEKVFSAFVATFFISSITYYTMAVISFFVFSIFYDLNTFLRVAFFIISLIAFGFLFVAMIIWKNRGFVEKICLGFGKFFSSLLNIFSKKSFFNKAKIINSVDIFYKSLREFYKERVSLFSIIIISHISTFLNFLGLYFILLSMDYNVPIYIITLVCSVSIMLSISPLPGGTGTLEVLMIALLYAIASVPAHVAFAAVLVYRLVTFWFQTLVGGISLGQLG